MRVRLCLAFLLLAAAVGSPGQSIAGEMLEAHNSVRARVGLRPLVWSDALAARAESWAQRLLARKEFVHTPKSPYGQNLFAITGGHAPPDKVVAAWASEAKDYDYRSNSCRATCGHYTQIVWRDTREVGCGVARGARREVWVCEYSPHGNWVGKRPY